MPEENKNIQTEPTVAPAINPDVKPTKVEVDPAAPHQDNAAEVIAKAKAKADEVVAVAQKNASDLLAKAKEEAAALANKVKNEADVLVKKLRDEKDALVKKVTDLEAKLKDLLAEKKASDDDSHKARADKAEANLELLKGEYEILLGAQNVPPKVVHFG